MNSLLTPLIRPPQPQRKAIKILPNKTVAVPPAEPLKKKELDFSAMEDEIPYIDDVSFSEEKEVRRMMGLNRKSSQKVTFSDPITEEREIEPLIPPTIIRRTWFQWFLTKLARSLCIVVDEEEDEAQLAEERRMFVGWPAAHLAPR